PLGDGPGREQDAGGRGSARGGWWGVLVEDGRPDGGDPEAVEGADGAVGTDRADAAGAARGANLRGRRRRGGKRQRFADHHLRQQQGAGTRRRGVRSGHGQGPSFSRSSSRALPNTLALRLL